MEALIRDRLPHAPQMGLFVAPDVPSGRLERALSDYASAVHREEVIALYDATLTGTGGDGAVFTVDRLVFQNNNLQATQTVRYNDLVEVSVRSRWFGFGGKGVDLTVNRGQATVDVTLDFSGAPDAAAYVADALETAMLHDITLEGTRAEGETNVAAVRRTLARLRAEGDLSAPDHRRLLDALDDDSAGSADEGAEANGL
ncbi:MAG: hypothetical protein R6T83_02655 [Salinibacter sp.]